MLRLRESGRLEPLAPRSPNAAACVARCDHRRPEPKASSLRRREHELVVGGAACGAADFRKMRSDLLALSPVGVTPPESFAAIPAHAQNREPSADASAA